MKATKKDVTPAEETSLVTTVPQTIENFNVENLIAKAIDQKLPVETMERFFTLAKEMQAIKAKQLYNEAMAAFQSQCPTIQKTKEGGITKSGQVAYHYAPLESIVAQVKNLLEKHGFSYSTSMEVLPAGVKVYVKVIHIAGHSEESCMQVPLGTITGVMSASQQTAAATTFAKRYAFCNAFGILTGDEDNDGANINQEEELSTPISHSGASSVKMATDKQMALIKDLVQRKRIKMIDLVPIFTWYKPGMKDLSISQAKELIDWLFTYVPKQTTNHIDKDRNIVDGPLPTIQQEVSQDEVQGGSDIIDLNDDANKKLADEIGF